jgi:putative heme-binding domain-containing protein
MLRAGLLSFFLLSSAAAQQSGNPLGSNAEVVDAGRTAYHQNCTSCHGLNGSAGDRAPALAAERSYNRTSDPELFDAIKNGIPGTDMPSMGLSEDDSWRIVAYLRSLRAAAADFPPDGDVAKGEQIYFGKAGCNSCHMIDAHGGLLGPDLTNLGAELTTQRIADALTVAKPHAPDGYVPVTARTTDGQTIRGVLKNENNFSFQILGADDRLHMLMANEIASMDRSDVSIMPADYDQLLSADEMKDLIAYLSRLVRRSE